MSAHNDCLYTPGTTPQQAGHVVPFTQPGSHWSQREYVECTKLRIGFAAHRFGPLDTVFHYHFPGVGYTSVVIGATTPEGTRMRHVYHEMHRPVGLDWIQACNVNLAAAGIKP